jgi:hypothetical protein
VCGVVGFLDDFFNAAEKQSRKLEGRGKGMSGFEFVFKM